MLTTSLKVECFGLSDIGLAREKNEDAWSALPDLGLYLVADGIGGHAGGEVAAHEAVNFLTYCGPELESGKMLHAFEKVNAHIYRKGQATPALRGMGTTICALYFHQEEAWIGHVGDSRIYLLRDDELVQLTEDHSLVRELAMLESLQPEEIRHLPYKHVLTKAIGTRPTVKPAIRTLHIQENDLFLLCTDGLTNYVYDREMKAILEGEKPIERKGFLLVDQAKMAGGADNITVVLAKIVRSTS